MINMDEICITHYCHPSNSPFMNICRLPKGDAALLAQKMANENPENESFARFSNPHFENHYNRRTKVDEQADPLV